MLLDAIMSVRRNGASESSSAVDGIIVCNTTTARPDSLLSAPTTVEQAGNISSRSV
jgi:dihydroorotate dehydrogenase